MGKKETTICLSKKDSKSLKNKSAPGKRKSENEMYYSEKKQTCRREKTSKEGKKKKMKYVQVQQKINILQDAIIAILRVKNPKTKLQNIRKKHTIKSLYTNEIFQKKLS